MLVALLAPITALVAAIVAIVFKGSTWDKRRKGWRRLTVTGWVIASVAIASFCVSAYREKQEANARAERQAKDALIRRAAASEINEAVGQLLRPFKLAVDASRYSNGGTNLREGAVLDRFLETPLDDLDRIGKAEFLETLDSVGALGCPPQFGVNAHCRWVDLFSQGAEQGDRALLGIIDRYAGVLDPKTLALISELRQDKMLSILKSAAGNVEMNQEMGKQTDGMTLKWLLLGKHEPTEYYVPFFRRVDQLIKISYHLASMGRDDPHAAAKAPSTADKQAPSSTHVAPRPPTQIPHPTQIEVQGGTDALSRTLSQLRTSASQGNADAQLKVGIMYDSGDGVEQDHTEAVKWFRLSALQGNATAQGCLALSYVNGEGVARDYVEAAKWYRLSALQGNVLAQYSLGILYHGGQITSQHNEAADWFKLAAAQGYANARFNLGVMYEKGDTVEHDDVRAYMWFGFAAESSQVEGREAASKRRDRVAAKMTPEQIAESDSLANKCRSSTYKDCD
jgi:TPR repeat protein